MSTDHDDTRLYDTVRSVYERHSERDSINPVWLATEVMVAIGFPHDLHPLGYLGCHLQVRQIARGFCRTHFDPVVSAEDDLFPETLQRRYPRRPAVAGAEPEYVRLDLLSKADCAYNVGRLRKEASAKLKHADALEAWGAEKFWKAA